MEHKAADRIVDQASVTEIPAEEWNTLAQKKNKDRKADASGGDSKPAAKKKTAKKKAAKKTASKDAGAKKTAKKTAKKKS